MPKRYYVIVSQLKNGSPINHELSGELWATTRSAAEIEAGQYRESLNWGGLEFQREDFHVVVAETEAQVRKLKGYTKWWRNRVTPKPPNQQ